MSTIDDDDDDDGVDADDTAHTGWTCAVFYLIRSKMKLKFHHHNAAATAVDDTLVGTSITHIKTRARTKRAHIHNITLHEIALALTAACVLCVVFASASDHRKEIYRN